MSIISPINSSEQAIKLIQEAHKLSPKKMGEVDGTEERPTDNFLKAAELWEQGAKVISTLSEEDIPFCYELSLHCSDIACSNNDRFNIISLCYANAAKCLLSAQYLEIFTETNHVGHSVDKKIQELFKKSVLADKSIDTSKMAPYWKLRLKERSLLTLRHAGGCLRTYENPDLEKIQRVTDKIYQKELKIAHDFEHIAKQKKGNLRELEWRCLMNSAHHRLIAGRLAPTPEKKQEILLRAEKIGRKIWFECKDPHSSCFPEFNPDRSNHVEGTVLGMIQQELDHCSSGRFGSFELLVVNVKLEKPPKEEIQL